MIVSLLNVSVLGIEVLLDVDDTVEDETTNEVVIKEDTDSEEVLISSPWELDNDVAEETVIGVVVGIDGNTEELSSDLSPIVGSEDDFCTRLSDVLNVSVLVEYIVDVREDDIVDVVTLYILDGDVFTEDVVLSIADPLDDDAMEDDIVVATTLDEVPLVVSVIILGDEEMVMYEVENVLNDSDTVVGVTVGTSVKLEDEAVVLISSPAILSMPSAVSVTDVCPLVDNDDVIEELSPTTGLLVTDVK